MRPVRTLGLLVAMAVLVAGLPVVEAQPPATVPFPLVGETFYFGATKTAERNVAPSEVAIRFGGTAEVLDREGAKHFAIVTELVAPAYGAEPHGDLDALLADPEAYRLFDFLDAATLERIETRSVSAAAGGHAVLPAGVGSWSYANEGTGRAFYDAGVRDPFGALWGQAVDDVVDAVALEGHNLLGSASATNSWVYEMAGTYASSEDRVRYPWGVATVAVPVALANIGPEVVAARAAQHYRGSFVAPLLGVMAGPRALDLWLEAGLALPVRMRSATYGASEGGGPPELWYVTDLTLAEHRPGDGALPWGATLAGGAFTPLGPGALGPWGPEDGATSLAYPLASAIRAVRQDPTLPRLRAMELLDTPVLVKAFYEERDGGDAWYPTQEARWWLMFHDSDGTEVIVESKRIQGAPVIVNREQLFRGAYVGPDIYGVAPEELPPVMPTIEGAIRAWEQFALVREAPANSVLFALQRMADGRVLPMLWAGWLRREGDGLPFAAGEVRLSENLMGVDTDGLPRLASDSTSRNTIGPGPLATKAAPAAPAAPGPGFSSAPAIAAAGMGMAAAAGILLKLAAPLYARLERGRVLEHPARRRLLALVEQQPGLPMGQARGALGIGAGAMMHHVAMLTSAGLLRVTRAGRSRRLYPARMTPQAASRDAVLRQPRTAALYRLARARPGVALREAARELGVPPSSLQWHVARLREAGLLERRGAGLHASP